MFEVEHQELGVRYALKTVLAAPTAPGFQLQQERFRREAELNARLDHPGILRIHSAALDVDPPYLVVDLLSGGSLGERLEAAGTIPVEEGIALALQLARALNHAHQAGVLHRDLKPENVMLDEYGAPRLVDFGLALEVGRESRLTKTGTAVGTPLTMAPEQVLGERSETSATDVYGLGATLYWAVSGEPPLGMDFPTLADVISAILRRPVTPLRQVRPEVPREFSDLLQGSLAKEPEERPTLERWIEVLELLQHTSGSDSSLDRLVARSTTLQKGALLATGTLLILGALATATLLLLPEEATRPPAPAANQPAAGASATRPPPVSDWRSAFRAGETSAARLSLLRDPKPISPQDAPLAAAVLASSPPFTNSRNPGPSLDGLAGRLDGLEDDERGALWALACIAAGQPKRGRKHADRDTTARELLRLEAERARVERDEVLARFAEHERQADLASARVAFTSLLRSLELWNPKLLQSLPPLDRVLADVERDRLLWTVSRLAFLLSNSARLHGTGTPALDQGLRTLHSIPEGPGLGRLALSLFFAEDRMSGHDPLHQRVYLRARKRAAELLADPAGRALYGSLASSCEQDPTRALRLGLLANDQTRAVADLSRHTRWLASRLVSRSIEVEWLGQSAPESEGLREALNLMRGVKGRQSDLYLALLAWHLSRRELKPAQAVLQAALQRKENDPDYHEALRLAQSEIELALDPAGAARTVLDRHSPPRGVFLEEAGLRAHAKALAGLDPGPELVELERRRAAAFRRVGFPWHAFDLPGLLDGRTWWPGLPK